MYLCLIEGYNLTTGGYGALKGTYYYPDVNLLRSMCGFNSSNTPPSRNFEMASILSSVFGRTKAYEPSPRCFQYAAPIGERLFLWGGRVPDFSARGRRNLASTVDIFDPYLETWKQQSTSGILPPGLYDGASASISNLYSFGGFDGASSYNSFHTLNPTTLQWNELQVLNQAEGPMRKRGCKMVVYSQDQLALFGGYGFPTGPNRAGVLFTKDTSFTDGRGWSNELHLFNTNEGRISSSYFAFLPECCKDKCKQFSF